MKKRLFPLVLMYLLGNAAYAQIGVGTVSPHPSAQMEVVSDTKGILIPRIALTGITDVSTVSNGNINSLLVFNTTDNELITAGYYYWMKNQWIRLVSADQVSSFKNTVNVSLTVFNNELILTDSEENVVKVAWNIEELVQANETTTTLTNNQNGTYTYVNEKDVEVVIDVPAEIISNFQQIIENTTVKNILNNYLANVIGNVTYDGIDFHYVDASNVSQTIHLNDLVKANETLTKLEIDGINRKLFYTDEKEELIELDLTPIIQEPWYKSGTEKGATLNTDNIFTLGWVGVGYEAPSNVVNEKLRVNGTITTVNSSYADYVFEDYFDGFSKIKHDYKFLDLESVANFIKANRHLPGITPIDALVKTDEGYAFNVSELSIQLLEKTEELYLHLIEQKKIMDEKNIEIKQLNNRLERLENSFLN